MPTFGPFPAIAAVGGPGAGETGAFFGIEDPNCATPLTITQGAYTGTIVTINAQGEGLFDHATRTEGYFKSGTGPRSYVQAQGAGGAGANSPVVVVKAASGVWPAQAADAPEGAEVRAGYGSSLPTYAEWPGVIDEFKLWDDTP